jgi:Na+/H+-dicarboxylate symporter
MRYQGDARLGGRRQRPMLTPWIAIGLVIGVVLGLAATGRLPL